MRRSPARLRWRAWLLLVLCWPTAADALRVRLRESDGPAVALSIHPGDEVEVELPMQSAAGYRWRVRERGSSVLTELGHTLRTDGTFSATGVQSFTWRAFAPGRGALVLEYGRSSNPGHPPEKTFVLQAAVASGSALPASDDGGVGPEPVGSYEGHLPCADCEGITERLTLYAGKAQTAAGARSKSDPTDTVYMLRREYGAASAGRTHVYVETGTWAALHGTPGNPDATVYRLRSRPDAGETDYWATDDRLLPLDAQGVPVKGPGGAAGDLSLHKVE